MSKTEALISELSLSARPIRTRKPSAFFLAWMVVSLVSLAGLVMLYGVRPDLSEMLKQPAFLIELTTHLTLMTGGGVLASAACFPGMVRKKYFSIFFMTAILGYLSLIMYHYMAVTVGADETPHMAECALCISSFAVVPALWYLFSARKLAVTIPSVSGSAALTMAGAVGCIGVRLVETEGSHASLLLWHYIPLLFLSFSGYFVGRKFIRW